MTEKKRFIPIFDGIDKRVVGAKDNGEIISFMDMFDLLNEQDVEIKSLKEELKDYSDANARLEERINRQCESLKKLKDLIMVMWNDY